MRTSKTSLFLLELIISILFFSLSAAVCVQLFVKAHQISEKSVDESHAVMWAESLAEAFSSCNGDFEDTCTTMENLGPAYYDSSSHTLTLSLNSKWELTKEASEAAYQAVLTQSQEDTMSVANIEILSLNSTMNSDSLYQLSIKKYCGIQNEQN